MGTLTTSKGKMCFFPISSIHFLSADLLIFVSDRIARAFIKSGATQAAALDICKVFNKVLYIQSFQ